MKILETLEDPLAMPSLSEWNLLMSGELCEIDGWAVINHSLIKTFMGYVLARGFHNTDRIVAVLELPRWHHKPSWWPRLLYFPDGHHGLPTIKTYFKVYFRRFHCFSCGLDVDGFALERDAYSRDTLTAAEAAARPLFLRCPRCTGDLRNPGLLHIIAPEDIAP